MKSEKRGAMADCIRLVSKLWLATSLALLAWVLVAPMETSGSVTVSSCPGLACRDFSPSRSQAAACLSAGTDSDDVLKVEACPSEVEDNDEKNRDAALCESRLSSLTTCILSFVPDRRPIAPPSILSFHPLRC